MIHVTRASTLVTVTLPEVRSAVLSLARRLWGVTDCDLLLTTPAVVMHRVAADGETACWLTWEFAAVTPAITRVDVIHGELAQDEPPDPELDDVLVHLLRECNQVRR